MDRVEKMRQKQKHNTFVEKVAVEAAKVKHAQDEVPLENVQLRAQAVDEEVRKPDKAPKVMVRFSCGHEKNAAHFGGAPCGECRDKARKAKAASWKARKQQAQPKVLIDSNRLPDRATFAAIYDARTMTWAVQLEVPGMETLLIADSSLEGGERKLARMCWDKLAEASK